MATPIEKDVETMPTRKIFKQRVRARMGKTGESYTAARHQLLRKALEPAPDTARSAADTDVSTAAPAIARSTSVEAIRRGTGRTHDEWFALLDAWGATERKHRDIAAWLAAEHGVGSWWSQSITVDYERARGLRALHETSAGFGISVSRTVAVDADTLLAAFTDPAVRETWLPDAPLARRPTRAGLSARFDWSDPPSRIVVTVIAKGPDKATVTVQHEQLPDAEGTEPMKLAWRERLGRLKDRLERA